MRDNISYHSPLPDTTDIQIKLISPTDPSDRCFASETMSVIHDRLLETSIYSSSQNHADPSQRSSKRFRPSVRCHHTNKQTHEQCTAEGFMECVHCDQICCLVHITEHQDELKQLRDDLIQVMNGSMCVIRRLVGLIPRKPAKCI